MRVPNPRDAMSSLTLALVGVALVIGSAMTDMWWAPGLLYMAAWVGTAADITGPPEPRKARP